MSSTMLECSSMIAYLDVKFLFMRISLKVTNLEPPVVYQLQQLYNL